MSNQNRPTNAITHTGIFHADEVFATAFLNIVNPNIVIERMNKIPNDIADHFVIYDIGGGEFDHHTKETAEFRDPERELNPYASFGKIVRGFGHFVFKNEEIQRIFDSILCVPIDLQDCNGSIWHGVTNTLSQAISSFNPTWMEEDDPSIDSCSDICFMEAVEIAEKIIHRYIKRAEAIYESERIVSEALNAKESDSHFIILERYVNYNSYLKDTDVNWVIYPSRRGGWQLYSVLDRGVNRQLIPEFMFNDIRFHKDCTFVHHGKFTAVFETCEAAVEVAKRLDNLFNTKT